jgi:hypothetical protein
LYLFHILRTTYSTIACKHRSWAGYNRSHQIQTWYYHMIVELIDASSLLRTQNFKLQYSDITPSLWLGDESSYNDSNSFFSSRKFRDMCTPRVMLLTDISNKSWTMLAFSFSIVDYKAHVKSQLVNYYSLRFGKWSCFGHDLSQTLGI